jgi:DNA replication and repair protein RecF
LFFPIRSNFILTLLRKISLFQFRNYPEAAYNIEAKLICICGKNGSGKTNLLDAIYTLCYTKSYFSATVQATILHGAEAFRIEGLFEKDNKKESVICKYKNGKKEISCAGIVYDKHAEHIGKYAAVMVAPDDIEMINDGSEWRRKFMDSILGQSDSQYLDNLLQYQKVLQQRNAWLKMYANDSKTDASLIEYYNSLLAPAGNYIYEVRKLFLKEFMPLLQKYYGQLSADKEIATIEYQSDLGMHSLEHLLEQNVQNDLRFQRTLKGIHKDELVFLLNGNSLKSFGSQGQKKSFLFSLKLAQYEYLKTKMNSSPILLLDDVFEKLDQQRMEALLNIISNPMFGQVILTDTHEQRVKDAFGKDSVIDFIRLNHI